MGVYMNVPKVDCEILEQTISEYAKLTIDANRLVKYLAVSKSFPVRPNEVLIITTVLDSSGYLSSLQIQTEVTTEFPIQRTTTISILNVGNLEDYGIIMVSKDDSLYYYNPMRPGQCTIKVKIIDSTKAARQVLAYVKSLNPSVTYYTTSRFGSISYNLFIRYLDQVCGIKPWGRRFRLKRNNQDPRYQLCELKNNAENVLFNMWDAKEFANFGISGSPASFPVDFEIINNGVPKPASVIYSIKDGSRVQSENIHDLIDFVEVRFNDCAVYTSSNEDAGWNDRLLGKTETIANQNGSILWGSNWVKVRSANNSGARHCSSNYVYFTFNVVFKDGRRIAANSWVNDPIHNLSVTVDYSIDQFSVSSYSYYYTPFVSFWGDSQRSETTGHFTVYYNSSKPWGNALFVTRGKGWGEARMIFNWIKLGDVQYSGSKLKVTNAIKYV